MDSNSVYCRFCAELVTHSKGTLIDLTNIATLEHYKRILALINVKFIDLYSEHLPKTVCNPCSLSIDQSFIFFEKAKLAQDMLADLFYVNDEVKVKIELDPIIGVSTTELITVKLEQSIKTEVVETSRNFNESTSHDERIQEFKYYNSSTDEICRNDDCDSDFEIKTAKSVKTHLLNNKRKCSAKSTKKKKSVQTLVQHSDSEQSVKENDSLQRGKAIEILKSAQPNNTLNRAVVTDIANVPNSEDYSWTDYNWNCASCNEKFNNMDELRDHSKAIHNICFGYKCKDCSDEFNIFGNFIEHVRMHIPHLRKYCYICNQKFSDAPSCQQHSIEHWLKSLICGLCGEMFPDEISFQRHKTAYKRKIISKASRTKTAESKNVKAVEYNLSKSWKDYDWICTYCNLQTSSVEALRLHSREVHKECFTMKCADCFKVSYHFNTFVSHVQLHRPHLQHYCYYCDFYDEDLEKLKTHVELHDQSSCMTCGVILEDDEQLFHHIMEYDVNIKAAKKSWPCRLCSKTFVRSQALRAHLHVHRERPREYVCEECGASFTDKHNMLSHRKLHSTTQIACQICKKLFKNEIHLKRHVKYLHLATKNIPCTECDKSFSNLQNLKRHMKVHSDVAKYKCEYCGRCFKRKQGLTIHLTQHTGVRPYSCKFCEKTFSSWGNCDKHMVLRHKTTLAKKKITPNGVVVLDEAGNPLPLSAVEDAKEWTDGLFKKAIRKSKITLQSNN